MSKIATIVNQLFRFTFGKVVLLLAAVTLSGCGSGNIDPNEARTQHGAIGTIQSCLEKGGARTATESAELDFLWTAEANEEISKLGLAYDRNAKVIVRIWTDVVRNGHPPTWTLWYGQPPEQSLGPREIVDEHPQDSYVLYIDNAPAEVTSIADRCISFDEQGRAQKPSLHSVSQ